MDEKLKPCPFCGGQAQLNLTITESAVKCTKCFAKIVRQETMEGAQHVFDSWNIRAAQPQAQVDEASFVDLACGAIEWNDGGLVTPNVAKKLYNALRNVGYGAGEIIWKGRA